MPTFNLYVIHTQRLTLRQSKLHGVIQTIRTTAQSLGHEVKITMILKPDQIDFDADATQKLDKRINYDKTNDEEFDQRIHPLAFEELSNYEKQREAWRRISEFPTESIATDLYMVIEDDAFILPNTENVIADIIRMLPTTTYDVATLSVSNTSATTGSLGFLDFRKLGKILPSKESYFLSPRAARVLYAQSETIKFPIRTQMSYILWKNPSLEFVYPSMRTMIDGSKIGVTPSTVNGNNVLIYNQEFMELWRFVSIEKPPVREIREIYKKIQHLRNPDILHLYGVLLYRAGDIHEAQDAFVEAVELMKENQGLLTFRSEVLNNAINIHEFAQWDLPAITAKPSKYDKN